MDLLWLVSSYEKDNVSNSYSLFFSANIQLIEFRRPKKVSRFIYFYIKFYSNRKVTSLYKYRKMSKLKPPNVVCALCASLFFSELACSGTVGINWVKNQ